MIPGPNRPVTLTCDLQRFYPVCITNILVWKCLGTMMPYSKGTARSPILTIWKNIHDANSHLKVTRMDKSQWAPAQLAPPSLVSFRQMTWTRVQDFYPMCITNILVWKCLGTMMPYSKGTARSPILTFWKNIHDANSHLKVTRTDKSQWAPAQLASPSLVSFRWMTWTRVQDFYPMCITNILVRKCLGTMMPYCKDTARSPILTIRKNIHDANSHLKVTRTRDNELQLNWHLLPL